VERLRHLGIKRYSHLLFLPRAMRLHRNLTVYDGLYVALAEALAAPLLTRDGRLARSAGRLIEVIHVR
jgi:predicted nucleic acid-binding protein